MTSSKPYRELLHTGLPIVLGQVGTIFVSFADNIMVGHHSTHELAAASFVNNIFALVFIFGMGFAYGLTPLVTHAYTRERYARAGHLMLHSLLLNVLVALVVSLLMLALYLDLEHTDLPSELIPIAKPYYLLQLLSFVLFMLFNAFKQFFDGSGRTDVGMWVVLASNGLNIFGNWLFIFGHWGLPEWGLWGAGLSTVLARLFTLLAFVYFLGRVAHFRLAFPRPIRWRLRRLYLRSLVHMGMPIGLYAGVEAGAFTIALLFVTKLGVIPLAVHQILCVVTTIGYFVYYGLGAATTILVSRSRARGDLVGARLAVRVGIEVSFGVALNAMLLMWLGRHQIGYIFGSDPALAEMVAVGLIPVILYQIGDALQVIYANALRGMQDVLFLAIAATAVHMGLEPLLNYVFGFRLGLTDPALQLTAIWSAYPIGLLTLGLLLRYRFRKITFIK